MDEVKKIPKNFKINCEYIRPISVSKDDTSMYETVIDLINWYEDIHQNTVEKIILLQPTNPLRLREDVKRILKTLDAGCESCFTIVPAIQSPYELIQLEEKKWSFLKKGEKVQRRQDYKEEFWFLDGSIYGCTKKFLVKYKKFVSEEVSLPIKCSKISSWDIDTPFDLAIAEGMLSFLKNPNKFDTLSN